MMRIWFKVLRLILDNLSAVAAPRAIVVARISGTPGRRVSSLVR
jgi:hypothetical protein